jgi:hypothetical protein
MYNLRKSTTHKRLGYETLHHSPCHEILHHDKCIVKSYITMLWGYRLIGWDTLLSLNLKLTGCPSPDINLLGLSASLHRPDSLGLTPYPDRVYLLEVASYWEASPTLPRLVLVAYPYWVLNNNNLYKISLQVRYCLCIDRIGMSLK